jgi:flagellar P-ring protein precursor FlgI
MHTTSLRRVSCVAIVALAILAGQTVTFGSSSRLKDIASLQGVSPVPLVGYGLVVGLNKTGDKRQTIFSTQTLANMLSRFGLLVSGEE